MYYRTARFYKFFGENGYESVGMIILLGSFSFYFIAILFFLSLLFNLPFYDDLAGAIIVVFTVIGSFVGNEKLFKKLELIYQEDRNKKMKGYWIAFFHVFSFIFLWIALLYNHINYC